MNKRNISKLLIFLMTASLGAVKAYGYAEAEQSVLTDVQPAVAIEKQTSSIENASANGETGAHTGLQSVFSIQTKIKKIEKGVSPFSIFISVMRIKDYTRCPIHSSRSPGRRSMTGTSTMV